MSRLNIRRIWALWGEACFAALVNGRKFCVLHRASENLFIN